MGMETQMKMDHVNRVEKAVSRRVLTPVLSAAITPTQEETTLRHQTVSAVSCKIFDFEVHQLVHSSNLTNQTFLHRLQYNSIFSPTHRISNIGIKKFQQRNVTLLI